MNKTRRSTIGGVLGAVLLGALAGSVSRADEPQNARGHGSLRTVYVDAGARLQNDYVYYPNYQVYYNSTWREYVYQDGSSWVSRPSPPRVSVADLLASPSVSLDFHDSPSIHHGTIARQYPKHWSPSRSSHDRYAGRNNRN